MLPGSTVTLLTMQMVFRSTSARASSFKPSPSQIVTSASRGLPMIFSPRASSRAFSTSERSFMTASHFSASASESFRAASASGMSLYMTLSASSHFRWGMKPQISSAVKLRMGASSLVMASRIYQMAVWALRRRRPSLASQ